MHLYLKVRLYLDSPGILKSINRLLKMKLSQSSAVDGVHSGSEFLLWPGDVEADNWIITELDSDLWGCSSVVEGPACTRSYVQSPIAANSQTNQQPNNNETQKQKTEVEV